MSLRRHCYHLLFEPRNRLERLVPLSLACLILLNIAAMMVATLPDLEGHHRLLFGTVEAVSIGIFVVEYLLRAWCIVEDPQRQRPVRGRLGYLASPLAVIDLLAILPALLPMVGLDLRALRAARLLRMLAILRMGRYSRGMRLFGRVFVAKRGELGATMMIVLVVLLCAATAMYHIEHEVQPEVFASIPHSLWWGIITLTTVGYGDAAPITALGRVVGGLIALLGVGVVALPAGIIAAGLNEEMLRLRASADDASDDAEHTP